MREILQLRISVLFLSVFSVLFTAAAAGALLELVFVHVCLVR